VSVRVCEMSARDLARAPRAQTTFQPDVKLYKLQLLQAAAQNKPALLRPFLEEGGLQWDEVRNNDRQNVLQVACLEGAEDAVEFMLRYPRVTRRIDVRDRANRTALHLAGAMGFDGVVSRLVRSKAEVDLQDDKGCTPLHLAVKFEWTRAVRVLLDAGADPTVEDVQGINAVDMANRNPDSEVHQMMAAYSGRPRRKVSTFSELQKCVLPNAWQKPTRSPSKDSLSSKMSRTTSKGSVVSRGSMQSRDRGAGVGRFDPSPENDQLNSALAEACSKRVGADGEVIEWDGLKPKLVKTSAEGSPIKEDSTKGSPSSWWRGAAEAESSGGGKQASVFRLQFYFDEQVKRLEFEVEWQEEVPAAGNVKPSGEADRRGLVKGDYIVETNGRRTIGKGREELLPSLKERPLVLKVQRTELPHGAEDPYMVLNLPMTGSSFRDHGLEVGIRGMLQVVTAVRRQSQAFAAGVLEGDAIVQINKRDCTKMSKGALKSALEEQPKSLTVWRRPLDGNIMAPWNHQE